MMIRPIAFDFNAQTAVNNSFQVKSSDPFIQEKALSEFDSFVQVLELNAVDVTVIQDSHEPPTPDSLFPNNWISFHEKGKIVLYPMYAHNRRLERKPAVLASILEKFQINETIDLTGFEQEEKFLEGTGSMVLDRENKIAYACISPRTHVELLEIFCNQMGYRPIAFSAFDAGNEAIYHTNVMMCVASNFAVVCLEAIKNQEANNLLTATLEKSGKKIIPITIGQMNQFAGNMLQVRSKTGQLFLVMSTRAFQSLTPQQVSLIQSYCPIIHASLDTIETNGGGSARCMMAEIFLPVK
ncbi:MAG: hypothetical protein RLZZ28_2739 [Bacteroidota bacterium]